MLARLSPVDFVLVEGYKRDLHVKIEVHRVANGKPLLYPEDQDIKALASDGGPFPASLPHAHLDDIEAIANLVERVAAPMDETLARLDQNARG
jgi:molybdopterin-guanine dinucleotide biosynthesis protein B